MKYCNNKKINLKPLKIRVLSIAMILLLSISFSNIQSQVGVNFNVTSQPLWGPVGHDYVNYYYLPEADVFYSVAQNKFFYPDGDKWVAVNNLPSKYNVDLTNTYKVVVNKPKPYLNHGYYVSNYAKFKKGGPKQIIIRQSNEPKYYKIKGHPKNIEYKSGKAKGHSKAKHKSKKDKK